MAVTYIDLNADIGELKGDKGRRMDRAILAIVTTCNIACGGHAGDDESMSKTVQVANDMNVRLGAHPSYPDRENFGRKSLTLPQADLRQSLLSQVIALQTVTDRYGTAVAHLKPHGALYNDCARDAVLAGLICETALEAGIPTIVGLPDSELQRAAQKAGLFFVSESFADRLYQRDGHLVSRKRPDAVLTRAEDVVSQALRLADKKEVVADTGEVVRVKAETICVHGDTEGATSLAAAIRKGLLESGITVMANRT